MSNALAGTVMWRVAWRGEDEQIESKEEEKKLAESCETLVFFFFVAYQAVEV
jgi:hypothetical protein